MKKGTVITVIVLLAIVVGAGWFFVQQGRIPAETETVEVAVDYSSLEKDTLYGEEEGKYENLPELGKRLLGESSMLPGCLKITTKADCAASFQEVAKDRSIVAVKGSYALLSIVTEKGEQFGIYDLTQGKDLGFHYISGKVTNEKIFIFADSNSNGLAYYTPGSNAFYEIPDSRLVEGKETYFTDDGMLPGIEAKISDDKLTISIFTFQQGRIETKKVREATFQLPLSLKTHPITFIPHSPQTNISTDGWKTYEDFGFKIKYPPQYSLEANPRLDDDRWRSATLLSIFDPQDTSGYEFHVIPLHIVLDKQPSSRGGEVYHTIEEYIRGAIYIVDAKKTNFVIINGTKALHYEFEQDGAPDAPTEEYIFIKNNLIYKIFLNANNPYRDVLIQSVELY